MIIDRMVQAFSTLCYPVDLGELVKSVHAILEEHYVSDIPISESTVRNIVLTSLDILDEGCYDLDTLLLEGLDDDYGFHDYDRVEHELNRLERISSTNEGS